MSFDRVKGMLFYDSDSIAQCKSTIYGRVRELPLSYRYTKIYGMLLT
jgi:hypothetical protein